MKDAHRRKQDDETQTGDLSGRGPMHKTRYKSPDSVCHRAAG
jgi:hypothetical protein